MPTITDWIMVGVTTAYVIFALLQWVAIRRQAKFARRTLRANHTALDLARSSAEAAKKSAEAMILSQRAQVYALPRQNEPLAFVSDRPDCIVEIRNVGATPAYKCTYTRWVALAPEPFQAPFKENRGITIYPNETYPGGIIIPFFKPLNTSEMDEWKNGAKALWFRVRFEYQDIFKAQRYAEFGWAFENGRLGSPRILPEYHDAN